MVEHCDFYVPFQQLCPKHDNLDFQAKDYIFICAFVWRLNPSRTSITSFHAVIAPQFLHKQASVLFSLHVEFPIPRSAIIVPFLSE